MSNQKVTESERAPEVAPRNADTGEGFVRRFLRSQFVNYGILPILLVVLIVAFAVTEPRFVSPENIINVVRQVSFIGIVVIGQMFYLITGNYDLSNGGTVALSSVVCASVMVSATGSGASVPQAILVGVIAGLMIGLTVGIINGVLIGYFKISSFMVTLGMGSAAVGVALLVAGGIPVVGLPSEFTTYFGTSSVAGIPFPTLVYIFIIVFAYVLLNWTRLGRRAYAVGGNASAAFQSGVNVGRTILSMMILGSLFAGLVGVMLTARVSTGEANIGIQYPLQSIIAAVIGGIALSGGEGRVSGAVMGALFIILLSNGMDLIRVQGYVQDILLGVLLIVALLVDRLRVRFRVPKLPARSARGPLSSST
ncbi:ABC transporter permease [Microcella alkaliphila]|uniref:Permease component of ribose/xylose/arabinose/ga lactoside ABC-type transporter n=1 Tax=Microcella alkaliphila TaxID=279828 RepID=A0A0U5BGV7_9MICO|nr:ABC transporter permease [Microcella alkaliphila]BAU33471.1 permease component of ribose/xylose/arabinose/ga lactoside ABC-type transporter [Microcella alkaliphila]